MKFPILVKFYCPTHFRYIDKTTVSSQCSPVTSSKVCLQWNNIEDQYDLVEATHVQYGSLSSGGGHSNNEDGSDGVLGRDSIGKRETTHCIEKLGKTNFYRASTRFRITVHSNNGFIDKDHKGIFSLLAITKLPALTFFSLFLVFLLLNSDADTSYEFQIITTLNDGQSQKSNIVSCTTKNGGIYRP